MRLVHRIFLLLAVLIVPASAHAQNCEAEAPDPPGAWTTKNSLTFNHKELRQKDNRLFVLEVDDGSHFQVLFECTAPSYFTYAISGDSTDASRDGATSATLAEMVKVPNSALTTRGLTMRHDSRFVRYKVSVRLRAGLAGAETSPAQVGGPPRSAAGRGESGGGEPASPPTTVLHGFEFDVWVVTGPDWKLGVVGGVGFSSLVDERFYIKPGANNTSSFEKAPAEAHDRSRPDVIALAHAYYSRTYKRFFNLGAAFGIGTSGGSPRYFIGPSIVFGKYFVFSPGISVGSVATAPLGQVLGEAPIAGANTLNTLSSRRMIKPAIAIGFTWIDRKDQFVAALASAASASGGIGSCVTSVSPAELAFGEDGAAKEVTVTAGDDCSWVATVLAAGASAFEVTKGGSGKGKGTITVKASAATDQPRQDVLSIVGPAGSAAKPVKLSQPRKSCVTAVGAGKDILAGGAVTPITVAIKATAGCQWTATMEAGGEKFTIAAPASGVGDGSVQVTPPGPAAAEQTATLLIVGPAGAGAQKQIIKQAKTP